MNTVQINAAITAIRECSLTMQESASFILAELPVVRIEEGIRQQTVQLCQQMISTKHDVFHELAEIDDLLASGGKPEQFLARLNRNLDWISKDIDLLDRTVVALRTHSNAYPEASPAYILVAESAVNILEAFRQARNAVDAMKLE